MIFGCMQFIPNVMLSDPMLHVIQDVGTLSDNQCVFKSDPIQYVQNVIHDDKMHSAHLVTMIRLSIAEYPLANSIERTLNSLAMHSAEAIEGPLNVHVMCEIWIYECEKQEKRHVTSLL